jgi:hypothetical protein
MPEGKPPRRPLFVATDDSTNQAQNELIIRLAHIREWAIKKPDVVFENGVLDQLDNVEIEQAALTATGTGKIMLERLGPMTGKLPMLIAAGWPWMTEKSVLKVTTDDAEAAKAIARRWTRDALRFAEKVGSTEFERAVQTCVDVLKTKTHNPGGWVHRRDVARACKVEARIIESIEKTLVMREEIEVQTADRPQRGGAPQVFWKLRR